MSRTFLIGTASRGSGPPGWARLVAAAARKGESLVLTANAVEQFRLVGEMFGNHVDDPARALKEP